MGPLQDITVGPVQVITPSRDACRTRIGRALAGDRLTQDLHIPRVLKRRSRGDRIEKCPGVVRAPIARGQRIVERARMGLGVPVNFATTEHLPEQKVLEDIAGVAEVVIHRPSPRSPPQPGVGAFETIMISIEHGTCTPLFACGPCRPVGLPGAHPRSRRVRGECLHPLAPGSDQQSQAARAAPRGREFGRTYLKTTYCHGPIIC